MCYSFLYCISDMYPPPVNSVTVLCVLSLSTLHTLSHAHMCIHSYQYLKMLMQNTVDAAKKQQSLVLRRE